MIRTVRCSKTADGGHGSRDEPAAANDTFGSACDEHGATPCRGTCDGSPLTAA